LVDLADSRGKVDRTHLIAFAFRLHRSAQQTPTVNAVRVVTKEDGNECWYVSEGPRSFQEVANVEDWQIRRDRFRLLNHCLAALALLLAAPSLATSSIATLRIVIGAVNIELFCYARGVRRIGRRLHEKRGKEKRKGEREKKKREEKYASEYASKDEGAQ
jgi:hypothetical protein